MKTPKQNQGFVLTAVMLLLLIASLVGGAFLFSARSSFATVDQWRIRDECLLGLQSGLEQREFDLDQVIRTNTTKDINIYDALASLRTTNVMIWTNSYGPSTYAVTTTVVTLSGPVVKNPSNLTASITLTNIATSTHKGITRKVREVVEYRYAAAPSVGGADGSVFDNVFFIDNIGLFSGVNADFNGDVYANKDVDLKYSSIRLNGDSYAGGENLSKNLYKNLAWTSYGSQSFAGIYFGDRVRPAEYTDYDRSNTNTYWPQGYDEVVTFHDNVEIKELPFIGPLTDYQNLAIATSGTVSQVYRVSASGVVSNLNTTVTGVWGDSSGENAGIGTNDAGCLILSGTVANPINISGVVVATGDIYIKGYYTGQGSLYAGRNIYIIGDLRAVNPPTWPHLDSNPQATAIANKTRDFLGLCAKGSLAFGDPGVLDVSFLRTPYTGSHASDASDAALGYVSYYSGGIPYFDGDYTQPDGNGSVKRSDGTTRYFYTPMIGNTAFTNLGVSARVAWMDVVLYANHLIAGDFDGNAVLNGGFVCRDESVTRHGNLALNWDIRLGSSSFDGMGFAPWLPGMLPRQTSEGRKVKWTELVP